MKYSTVLLFWLLLVFGLIVFSEHVGTIDPLLLWAILLFLFVTMSVFTATWAGARDSRWLPPKLRLLNQAEKTITAATRENYAAAIAPYLALSGWKTKGPVTQFEGTLKTGSTAALAGLNNALLPLGQSPFLLEGDGDEVRVVLIPVEDDATTHVRTRWWLHGLLFFLS